MGEGVSEEVGIDFAVSNGAGVFFGVSVCSGVGGAAETLVVVGWSEWEGQVGKNINVLHGCAAHGACVYVIDTDAVLAQPPPVTETVDVVHDWSSWEFGVTEMTPATVLEDVGQGEKVHDVSIVSGGPHHLLVDLQGFDGGFLLQSCLPDGFEVVSHGNGAHRGGDKKLHDGFLKFDFFNKRV
jgi:hypothetical protein